MTDNLKDTNYILKEVSFEHLGGRYHGPGILKWRSVDGFHLEAFLNRDGPPLPKRIEYRGINIVTKDNLCTMRMKLWPSGSAIAPDVPLSMLNSPVNLLDHGYLSIRLNRVLFFSKTPFDKPNKFIGSAILMTKGNPMLFDRVEQITTVNGENIGNQYTRSGIRIHLNEKGQMITGLLDNKTNQLTLDWSFNSENHSKAYSWRWPQAASDALSILYGQTMWLVQRETYRQKQFCVEEIRFEKEVQTLGYLSPFDPITAEKDHFIKLTDYFANDGEHAETCRNIFRQIVAASQQQTRPGKELMLSTILEAVLRNVDERPFVEGDGTWDIGESLRSFRMNYLSDKWTDACDDALSARKRLRHRNAHPDWLFSQGGSLSDEEMEKSLDDMIFLRRFYGYMIKALAGFRNLKPEFPKPYKEWEPMIVRTSN